MNSIILDIRGTIDYLFCSPEDSYDYYVGKTLGIFLILSTLNLSLKQTAIIPTNGLSLFVGIVFLGYVFRHRKHLFLSSNINNLLLMELMFSGLILLSCIRYIDDRNEIVSRCIYTIVFCVPFYVFGRKVKNTDLVVEGTKKSLYVVVLLSAATFLYLRINPNGDTYNMQLGYALMYPMLVFWKNRREKSSFFLWIVSISIILLTGSRGPLLPFIFFIAITQIKNKATSGEVVKRFVFLILVLIGFFQYKAIIKTILDILGRFNISSRSLSMLYSGIATSDSGRREVLQNAIDVVLQNPYFGVGIAGDIPTLGYYPHNVFVELLLDYGIPIGFVLNVIILFRVFHNTIQKKASDKEAYLLFVAGGLMPLLISNTYLQHPLFWILIGMSNQKLFQL